MSGRSSSPKHKLRDVVAILLLTASILSIAALLSYHPEDPPNGTAKIISNRLGIGGAYIANILVHYTFGRYISLLIPGLIALFALTVLIGKGLNWTFRIGMILGNGAIITAAGWGVLIYEREDAWEYVGLIGGELASLLLLALGKPGALILICGLILVYLTIVFGVRWNAVWEVIQSVGLWLWGILLAMMQKWRAKAEMEEVEIESEEPLSEYQGDKPIKSVMGKEKLKFDTYIVHHPKERVVVEPDFLGNGAHEIGEALKELPATGSNYVVPPVDLLIQPEEDETQAAVDERFLREQAARLEESLAEYGVDAHVLKIHPGPVVTRFDLKPAPGIKVNRITALEDDLTMAMEAPSLRIIAPIPGEGAVGIEIPNPELAVVRLGEIVTAPQFLESKEPLLFALGKTAQGDVFVADLAKMPHLLIAGTTGSGKSVCINTIITCLLLKNRPDEVMIALIDPKKIELSIYAELRRHHLLYLEEIDEVIATEPKNAVLLLRSIVMEMERRYDLLAETGARSILEFNRYVEEGRVKPDEEGNLPKKLPHIVTIIDELADLMLTAAKEVEEPIARLAQMARAIGIHLVVATQRPSVDVITGVIKANFPARLAFMVASKIDSRTILDRSGAEALLGRGDALLMTNQSPHPIRLHAALITTDEVHAILKHVCRQPAYIKLCSLKMPEMGGGENYANGLDMEGRDPLFAEAARLVVYHQQGSVSLIQRRLKVGYSRAGRILDQLEQANVVGPFEGSKAREVLMKPEDLEEFLS